MITQNDSKRGLTAIIGFLAVVVIVILFSGILLNTAVPAVNSQAESDHNADLRATLSTLNERVLATGTKRITIDSTIDYVLLNTNPNIEINTSEKLIEIPKKGSYTTDSLTFNQKYRYIQDQSYSYEQSALYSDGSVLSKSFLVTGDKIQLHLVDASVSRSAPTTELQLDTTVTTEDTITIDSSNNTIRLVNPNAPVSVYTHLESQENVTAVSKDGDDISIELESGEYEFITVTTTIS